MSNKKIVCKQCRDRGLKGGCPRCGKVLEDIPVTILQNKDGVVTDDMVIATIPIYYRGNVWNKNIVIDAHKELDGKNAFDKFVSQLDKIHNIFVDGKIPNKSAIIIAPRTFSKQTWANSCIQFGMKSGHKMMPVMSSNLIKRSMANMIEKPNNKFLENLGYNLEDILTADCLFVTIDSGWQHESAYAIIDEVMCMRSGFDRPTIFLSRFSIEELTKRDYNGTFNSAISASDDVNRLRYPAVIQYII